MEIKLIKFGIFILCDFRQVHKEKSPFSDLERFKEEGCSLADVWYHRGAERCHHSMFRGDYKRTRGFF